MYREARYADRTDEVARRNTISDSHGDCSELSIHGLVGRSVIDNHPLAVRPLGSCCCNATTDGGNDCGSHRRGPIDAGM